MLRNDPIHIIGGGLAGAEAAWQISKYRIPVIIYEMRPKIRTSAHNTEFLAELVCSNSFRSDDSETNAVGLLHDEMRKCQSLIMEIGDQNKVPAGSAMAVDRLSFSKAIQKKIEENPFITVKREEISIINLSNWKNCIIASGPLTSSNLSEKIQKLTGKQYLAFFDSIAPIVYKETINMHKAWFQSRYDKSSSEGNGKDYINCPLNKENYNDLINKIIASDKLEFKEWEKNTPYFESCLPIEVMAKRGIETLRYGPLKPIGLTNKHHPTIKPWAVVQLRQDNKLGTLYNIVGFQTKMNHSDQKRVFRTIPGLESAEFARLGGIHRNTFINSPELLDKELRLKKEKKVRFAGQITGVEGYVESAAIGLLAGKFTAYEYMNKKLVSPPNDTALGSLLNHITSFANKNTFQPMNVNFGLFPSLENKVPKKIRRLEYTKRAKLSLSNWLSGIKI